MENQDKPMCIHSPSNLNSTLTCGVMKEKCECCGKQDIAYWCEICGWGNIRNHKNGNLTMTQKTHQEWNALMEVKC